MYTSRNMDRYGIVGWGNLRCLIFRHRLMGKPHGCFVTLVYDTSLGPLKSVEFCGLHNFDRDQVSSPRHDSYPTSINLLYLHVEYC